MENGQNFSDPKSRSNWRKWAIKNHPDKGGNAETFQMGSNCFENLQNLKVKCQ